MEALAEAERKLKHSVVRGEDQNVSRRVENRRTDFAVLQMFLHLLKYLRREGAIEVTGDVLPNMLALYVHENHLRFGLTLFNCGTSFFCSIMRARCSRTLTDAIEMPSASA